MPIQPGNPNGGRPPIGPKLTIAIPQNTLNQIQAHIKHAHQTRQRIPRHLKNTQNYIRHALNQHLQHNPPPHKPEKTHQNPH